jgi:hypothetical protein
MHYDVIEKGMQGFLKAAGVFTPSQLRRVVQASSALILAGDCPLREVARFVHRRGKQPARIQWVRRQLDAAFLQPEYGYEPVLRSLLAAFPAGEWHVLMDRTHIAGWQQDVVTVALSYRKRALPLVWCRIPPGRASTDCILHLLERSLDLIPPAVRVIFQGDCEFAHVAILRWVRDQGWDFIGAQTGQTHFYHPGEETSQALSDLNVRVGRTHHIAHALLGQSHRFGDVDVYVFRQPHHRVPSQRSREMQYLATSLPSARLVRMLGKRRWGIECLFQDWKSGGWDIEASCLEHPQRMDSLLTLLALVYLWLTLLGRWLCKIGQRHLIDNQPKRHLSLFHIGWDWLIYQWRAGHDIPSLSMLPF